MFFLVYLSYYITYLLHYYFSLTGGRLWWAIEGIYVSGIHIVGGVNMCIYSRIYTGNTLKNEHLPISVYTPPLVGGGICARKCVFCTLIYSTIGLVFLS